MRQIRPQSGRSLRVGVRELLHVGAATSWPYASQETPRINSRAHAVIRTIGVRRWQREALLRADQYFSYSWVTILPFGSSLRRTESDWWYQCIGL